MGEYAEMMLDGTCCSSCGDYLGGDDGYPVECRACRGATPKGYAMPAGTGGKKQACPTCGKLIKGLSDHMRDAHGSAYADKAPASELSPKLIKHLSYAASDGLSEMYPGDRWDTAPKQYRALEQLGLVSCYIPHNPVHKERAVATDKGRAMLEARSAT